MESLISTSIYSTNERCCTEDNKTFEKLNNFINSLKQSKRWQSNNHTQETMKLHLTKNQQYGFTLNTERAVYCDHLNTFLSYGRFTNNECSESTDIPQLFRDWLLNFQSDNGNDNSNDNSNSLEKLMFEVYHFTYSGFLYVIVVHNQSDNIYVFVNPDFDNITEIKQEQYDMSLHWEKHINYYLNKIIDPHA